MLGEKYRELFHFHFCSQRRALVRKNPVDVGHLQGIFFCFIAVAGETALNFCSVFRVLIIGLSHTIGQPQRSPVHAFVAGGFTVLGPKASDKFIIRQYLALEPLLEGFV